MSAVIETQAEMLLESEKTTIPEGYKNTEIGLIPKEWELLTLNDIATFIGGAQPPRTDFISKPAKGYVRLIQIRDYKTSAYETYIPEELARKKCSVDDIMIGRYGPPIFQILRGIEGAYNVALIKALPNERIEKEYLFHFLKNEKLFQLMELLSQRSSGQTGVELPALKEYPIPLPPKPEQKLIATALSDMDSLISSLEKLISKKQSIKEATMQQLLTGRTRLPEFAKRPDGTLKGMKDSELGEISEDWNCLLVGSIASIQRGASPRPIDDPIWFDDSSTVGWLRISDVSKASKFLTNTTQSLSEQGIKHSRYVSTNNLVMSICATVGKPIITKMSLCIHDGFVVFKKLKIEMHYLYYVLQQLENSWGKQGQIGSQMNLNTDIINSTAFLCPPSKSEQIAIATVLDDIDNEISTLQSQLQKTRTIKHGMMQELLTGKTRLM